MLFRCALTIRSDTRYLAVLRDWVRAACRACGEHRLPKGAAFAASVALVEAVDNAIIHAHGRRRKLPIRIELALRPDALAIDVIDRGKGIGHHPAMAPEMMASRGRGLFLIGRVMARVKSTSRRGEHRLRMEWHL
jgi:anti-sigma regulatory factor (Ser/Thr protein kinase)